MTDEQKIIRAFEALSEAVFNSADPDDPEPPGGTEVQISYNPKSELVLVAVELDGGGGPSAEAPTLTMALNAVRLLDEGESVVLNEKGEPLCVECYGAGCKECMQTGRDKDPPHAWNEVWQPQRWRKRAITITAQRMSHPFQTKTMEGELWGKAGDWLVTGLKGEQYPVDDEIFRATYEGPFAPDIEADGPETPGQTAGRLVAGEGRRLQRWRTGGDNG